MTKTKNVCIDEPRTKAVRPINAIPKESVGVQQSYYDMRDSIIAKIKETRVRLIIQANSGMTMLYWNIGNEILQRQKNEGWGAKVIDRLSKDLKEMFPDMSGFSPRNLLNMKRFAEAWTDLPISQQAVAKLPWRSNMVLMEKLQDAQTRLWYAEKLIENGWSSNVLDMMISTRAIERHGKAVSNFSTVLPSPDSDMAQEIFGDPYLFDCLGADERRREAEIERSLIEHIEKFLLELGRGFAFVGRQVLLKIGDNDFFIDLLFYHLKLRCYVVIELKTGKFEPGFLGQLNFYQNAVNDLFRHPEDKETIGLLLVKGKNRTVVEYSLTGFKNPIGVADWQERLEEELQADVRSSLPTIEEIERELDSKDPEKKSHERPESTERS